MISIAEAIQIVKTQTAQLFAEDVAIDSSRGRILAENIVADTDLPPFDRAQMDGYAVRAADVGNVPAHLQIVGESAAGAGWHHEMKAGEAVRIMTGAPVPTGADAVQQVELTRESDSQVEILEPVELGRSIVRRASEIKSGETVLRAGEEINAAMIATLASFGYAKGESRRAPEGRGDGYRQRVGRCRSKTRAGSDSRFK
jgi:molybdopterin biosynthesis enzyme